MGENISALEQVKKKVTKLNSRVVKYKIGDGASGESISPLEQLNYLSTIKGGTGLSIGRTGGKVMIQTSSTKDNTSKGDKSKDKKEPHDRTLVEILKEINEDQKRVIDKIEKFLVLLGWNLPKNTKRYKNMKELASDLYYYLKAHKMFQSSFQLKLFLANCAIESIWGSFLIELNMTGKFRGAGYLQITGTDKGLKPGNYKGFYEHLYGESYDVAYKDNERQRKKEKNVNRFTANYVADNYPWESACYIWTRDNGVNEYLTTENKPFLPDWKTTWREDRSLTRVIVLISKNGNKNSNYYTYYRKDVADKYFNLVYGSNPLLGKKLSETDIQKIDYNKLNVYRYDINQLFYRVCTIINGNGTNTGLPNHLVERYLAYQKIDKYLIRLLNDKGECFEVLQGGVQII